MPKRFLLFRWFCISARISKTCATVSSQFHLYFSGCILDPFDCTLLIYFAFVAAVITPFLRVSMIVDLVGGLYFVNLFRFCCYDNIISSSLDDR